MKCFPRIRDLREDNDKTQLEVANDFSMQLTQYRRYENGESRLPFDFAVALAEYYNVSLDYIAGLSRNKKPLYQDEDTDELLAEAYGKMTNLQKRLCARW